MTDVVSHAAAVPAKTKDSRQDITNEIIEMLEKGVSFWEKPWKGIGRHHNPVTGTVYSGGNALRLLSISAARDYADPRWVTINQIGQLNIKALRDEGVNVELRENAGGKGTWPYDADTGKAIKFADFPVKLNTGSKGAQIEFWKEVNNNDLKSAPTGNPDQPVERGRLMPFHSTVFNASCVSGMPALPDRKQSEFSREELLEKLTELHGVTVTHTNGDQAFYSPSTGEIGMPAPDSFKSTAAYYSTLLHEEGHWAMSPQRLNLASPDYFTSKAGRAKEELRAELTSVFVASELGLLLDMGNHASYVKSWADLLKDDKNEIFRAAAAASKVADYLTAPLRERGLIPEINMLDLGPEIQKQAAEPAKKRKVVDRGR